MLEREFVLITSLKPELVVEALHRKSEFRATKTRPVAALFEGGSISRERFEPRLFGQLNHAGQIHARHFDRDLDQVLHNGKLRIEVSCRQRRFPLTDACEATMHCTRRMDSACPVQTGEDAQTA